MKEVLMIRVTRNRLVMLATTMMLWQLMIIVSWIQRASPSSLHLYPSLLKTAPRQTTLSPNAARTCSPAKALMADPRRITFTSTSIALSAITVLMHSLTPRILHSIGVAASSRSNHSAPVHFYASSIRSHTRAPLRRKPLLALFSSEPLLRRFFNATSKPLTTVANRYSSSNWCSSNCLIIICSLFIKCFSHFRYSLLFGRLYLLLTWIISPTRTFLCKFLKKVTYLNIPAYE